MRWVRYEAEGKTSYGILEGNAIEEVSGDMLGEHSRTGTRRSLDSGKLLAPLEPLTFYAAGVNYIEHITEACGPGFQRIVSSYPARLSTYH